MKTTYTKKYMIKASLEAIKKYNLIFIDEIFAYVPFSRALYYVKQLDKLDELNKEILNNKIKIKKSLQKKWHDSSNPITQLALYKLVGTNDERKRIVSAQVELKGQMKIKTFKVGYDDDSNKEKPSPKTGEDSEQ